MMVGLSFFIFSFSSPSLKVTVSYSDEENGKNAAAVVHGHVGAQLGTP